MGSLIRRGGFVSAFSQPMTHNCEWLTVGGQPVADSTAQKSAQHEKSALFFAPAFYDTLRYAKKVSEPPPRYVMTGGARLAFSDTHKHHTYRKI